MAYCYSEHPYRHGRERELMHTLGSWPLGLSYCTVSIPMSPIVCDTSAKLKILLQHSTHLHRIHTGLGPLWLGGRAAAPLDPPSPRPPSCCAVLGCMRACMYGAHSHKVPGRKGTRNVVRETRIDTFKFPDH
jgi:hypothetical protein